MTRALRTVLTHTLDARRASSDQDESIGPYREPRLPEPLPYSGCPPSEGMREHNRETVVFACRISASFRLEDKNIETRGGRFTQLLRMTPTHGPLRSLPKFRGGLPFFKL